MARLDVNDCWNINGEHATDLSVTTGPYYTCARPGGGLNITCIGGGPGFQAVALWIGPLNVNVANFGANGQMDTGTPDTTGDGIPESIFVIGDGTNPTPTLLDFFFFTDAAGIMDIKLQINPSFPPGVLGTLQAVMGNGPAGIFLTNAVVLEIIP
ncbi:MAG: hypothetical protein ACI97A_000930 [Planctomycetota bacterium]|jgi:hypothetical protein